MMIERDKVIDALKEAGAYFRSSFDAMYGTLACEKFRNWTDAIEQAIALLKAQEPVKPCYEKTIKLYICGQCGVAIGVKGLAKYCINCGQAVKWE